MQNLFLLSSLGYRVWLKTIHRMRKLKCQEKKLYLLLDLDVPMLSLLLALSLEHLLPQVLSQFPLAIPLPLLTLLLRLSLVVLVPQVLIAPSSKLDQASHPAAAPTFLLLGTTQTSGVPKDSGSSKPSMNPPEQVHMEQSSTQDGTGGPTVIAPLPALRRSSKRARPSSIVSTRSSKRPRGETPVGS